MLWKLTKVVLKVAGIVSIMGSYVLTWNMAIFIHDHYSGF